MTRQEFLGHLAGFTNDLRKMSDSKGVEYANSEDQLANFKRLEKRLDIPAEKVAIVLLTKHLDAIDSAVKKGKALSDESFRSRCLDAVLYLILLSAIHEERALAAAGEMLGDAPSLPPVSPPVTR